MAEAEICDNSTPVYYSSIRGGTEQVRTQRSGIDTPHQTPTGKRQTHSQEVSPFPAGHNKAHINRRVQRLSKHKTENTQKIYKRSTAPKRSVKYSLQGPNRFYGANPTLKSDVDQN